MSRTWTSWVSLVCVGGLLAIGSLRAADETRFAEKFEGKERPAKWAVNFGHWEPADGVLVVRQLDKDNHAAASRWQVPLSDCALSLKAKFEGATMFHVGFDPMAGQLKKQGHLYSLVVSPTKAQLKKHRDKADDNSKDETLAEASLSVAPKEWFTIELKAEGEKVSVKITGKNGSLAKLDAQDASFKVAKPAVVFRVIGGDVHFDDVDLQVLKPAGATPVVTKKAKKAE